MPEKTFEEGHCSHCGSERADVLAKHREVFHDGDFQAVTHYMVLECRGCGYIYFKSSSTNSEDFDYFFDPEEGDYIPHHAETNHYWPPSAKRRRPEWIDEVDLKDRVLGSLFNDVYTALSNNLGVLAAIGMRTVFDRASELLGIDSSKTFKDKLEALRLDDHITEKEATVLAVLIDAGNAAAHRGWRPKPKQLDAMMTILEAFLHRAFLLAEVGAELHKDVPVRSSKRQKSETP